MSYIMVDIESDGPIPGDYSMICFGAVLVEPGLARSFYGQLRPISEKWLPDALRISGFSREQALAFDEPALTMTRFAAWIAARWPPGPQPMTSRSNVSMKAFPGEVLCCIGPIDRILSRARSGRDAVPRAG